MKMWSDKKWVMSLFYCVCEMCNELMNESCPGVVAM